MPTACAPTHICASICTRATVASGMPPGSVARQVRPRRMRRYSQCSTPSRHHLCYNANGTSCFCDDHPQLCACSVASPRNWEQYSKWAACLAQLEAYERTNRFRYDLIMHMRSDYQPVASDLFGVTARVVLAAVGRLSEGRSRRTVFFQPWWYACYGMLDWFLIGGREESAAHASLTSAAAGCAAFRSGTRRAAVTTRARAPR